MTWGSEGGLPSVPHGVWLTPPGREQRFRDVDVHLWSFGADGRVKVFRHVVDTVKHVEAVTAQALV